MKKIGITTRILTNDINIEIEKIPHSLIEKIEKLNVTVIIIPCVSDVSFYLDLCDGFIIPGGNTWNGVDVKVLKYAMKHNKPLLGICAGMQAIANINTFMDHTIKVDSDINHYVPNEEYVHEININEGILKDIIGKNKISVNSRHHDTIINENFFKVEARSDDGIIEAISLNGYKFIFGVQWHPEDMDDIDQDKLFKYFISLI